MTPRIFAYIPHRNGIVDDSAAELLTAARNIAASSPVTAIVTGSGNSLETVCQLLRASYAEVWKVDCEALAYPNAEIVRKALVSIVPAGSIVLVVHSHFGVDLSPGLAVKLNCPYVPDVVDVELEGALLNAVRQEFGGQVSAHVRCDVSSGAVINIRPGAFKPQPVPVSDGSVVDRSADVGALTAKRRYIETVVADTGDVDITKYSVLVSVGRGFQEQDNVAIAEELAEAMGGAVSCSRPVVDAKWMPKSRQVGSSGQTVRPKVYLACGISGSFQHMAGIQGNPLIIAINKNPKAPIFRVANIGVVDDVLEFLPALTDTVRDH